MSKLVNPFTRALLRSPVHDLLSDRIVLLSLRGNRSGRRLSIPVNYLLDDEDVLTILSLRRRAWWRNLRGGAPLTALLAGRERQGRGSLPATDTPEVADQLRRMYAAAGHPISEPRAAGLAPEPGARPRRTRPACHRSERGSARPPALAPLDRDGHGGRDDRLRAPRHGRGPGHGARAVEGALCGRAAAGGARRGSGAGAGPGIGGAPGAPGCALAGLDTGDSCGGRSARGPWRCCRR